MFIVFGLLFLKLLVSVSPFSYHEQYRVPSNCSDKWESYIFNDKEYIIQNLPLKWKDAEILCSGYHDGTLAVLDSAEKADFLAEALSESKFFLESLWVGARRASEVDPLGYRWLSGAPLRRSASDILHGEDSYAEQGRRYPMWVNRTHVPVPDGGADCVAIDRVFHDKPVLLDLPCRLERGFVCERDAKEQVSVRELKIVRCKTGLYHVYNGLLSWEQAAAYCVLKKMTLANVATLRCLKKLGMTMLKSRPSIENAWVGARGERGSWQWIDSGVSIFIPSPFLDTNPAKWPPLRDRSSIKPNGCLQLDRHASHPPVFLEARCERKMQFICYEGALGAQTLRTQAAPPSDENYYYVLVRQSLYWQDAFENCLKMNGTLAFIENNDVLIQLMMLMGENKDEPISHIWLSGRLNMTRDVATDSVSYVWYNPSNGKNIRHTKSGETPSGETYMAPWLEDDFSIDNPCMNLDRQDHLTGLVYGLPCNMQQYSICMIEKGTSKLSDSEANIVVPPTTLEPILATESLAFATPSEQGQYYAP